MNVATTSKHSYAIRPNGQPGSMTAVMRAVTEVTGPRVLRVGLVQGGRVLDDRILKERTTVTVGTSEKATFVVTTEGLGPLVRLFERVGDDYYLHVLAGRPVASRCRPARTRGSWMSPTCGRARGMAACGSRRTRAAR